ncbi:class I SAM-dependent RNA methyltransferase [Alisedimentitalea sp. MJ-SS2]|uniref:THUMP domain-containing class I SAM-dependent RNA methyltransferase n=1 Tax=Aliisedimentitalea sp. MJ-SS2 TaxID=3049795 RepID=UPI0029104B16|nr:class I SAM-dependent RNA methyltransferase [Alisedimentitalea sp. MJ-SS2]MDU8926727.1 class I SAM-dependent RNA methyltransferase [Alisedimentitalea sp. MJ-SS2]
MSGSFEIFMSIAPGLEPILAEEARDKGFDGVEVVPGGVTVRGGWQAVWQANLEMRGAARVLVRVGAFRAFHLAQLDKRARKFPWGDVLRADVPVKVEVTTKRSKIYHAGAAAQRIERALSEELGVTVSKQAALAVKVRIDDNLVTISLDSSGEGLHKRGHKEAVGKAPMRETLAALFLRACGHRGDEPVVDPMCGSGTFPIEAAEMAAGMQPGRGRGFAFERFAGFEAEAFEGMRRAGPARLPGVLFHGYDRDQGAIRNAGQNAERAAVAEWCRFACQPVSALEPPEGKPGLVIANPPYGGRIGNRKMLFSLYGSFGRVLRERFKGWRVGVVTSDAGLAKAMDVKFQAGPPVDHGGLKVKLYQSGVLG